MFTYTAPLSTGTFTNALNNNFSILGNTSITVTTSNPNFVITTSSNLITTSGNLITTSSNLITTVPQYCLGNWQQLSCGCRSNHLFPQMIEYYNKHKKLDYNCPEYKLYCNHPNRNDSTDLRLNILLNDIYLPVPNHTIAGFEDMHMKYALNHNKFNFVSQILKLLFEFHKPYFNRDKYYITYCRWILNYNFDMIEKDKIILEFEEYFRETDPYITDLVISKYQKQAIKTFTEDNCIASLICDYL
jgi:hypothetical protein